MDGCNSLRGLRSAITITERDGTHSKLGRDRLTLPRCYALRPRSSSSSGRLGSRPCRPLLLPSFLHSGNSPDEPAPMGGPTDRRPRKVRVRQSWARGRTHRRRDELLSLLNVRDCDFFALCFFVLSLCQRERPIFQPGLGQLDRSSSTRTLSASLARHARSRPSLTQAAARPTSASSGRRARERGE